MLTSKLVYCPVKSITIPMCVSAAHGMSQGGGGGGGAGVCNCRRQLHDQKQLKLGITECLTHHRHCQAMAWHQRP